MSKIKSTSVEFKSGLLLSREILEQMESQSHLFKLQYDSYPDGIIYGFELFSKKNKLYLKSGLLKFKGDYYFSTDSICVTDILEKYNRKLSDDDNTSSNIALAFVPTKVEKVPEGLKSEFMELKLVEKHKLKEEYIIVAECQYYKDKKDFIDENRSPDVILSEQLETEGRFFTFLNVKYSLPNENVFSPYIYNLMKECLSSKRGKLHTDTMLLFMLSQNPIVSFDVLKVWFDASNLKVDMTDRKSIIKAFLSYINPKNTGESKVTPTPEPKNTPSDTSKSKSGRWNIKV